MISSLSSLTASLGFAKNASSQVGLNSLVGFAANVSQLLQLDSLLLGFVTNLSLSF
jgi:hypothetical protein